MASRPPSVPTCLRVLATGLVPACALALAPLPLARPAAAPSATADATHAGSRARAAPARLPQPGEFNVLLVVLDDLGTDQLSIYASDTGAPTPCGTLPAPAIPTPALDALRAGGVLFTRCYANPTCSPTRAAILTGRYGRRTGMGNSIRPIDNPGYALPTGEITVAEAIRDWNPTPYRRAAFGKWHVADDDADDCHPAECGFERFEGHMGNNEASHYAWRKVTSVGGSASGCVATSSAQVAVGPGNAPSAASWDASVTRADAVAWIRGLAPGERFFACVCFNPPHAPFEVPPDSALSATTIADLQAAGYHAGDRAPAGAVADERRIYAANIEAVDHELGELLTGIPAMELARTIVLVVGDNGTLGTMIHDPALIEHGKRSLHELGTRVPLVVSGPIAPAGGTCRSLVGTVDLWRTIAELSGVRSADIDLGLGGTPSDAESFLDGIQRPDSALARTTAYSEAFPNGAVPPANVSYLRGITDGTWRYMRLWSESGVLSQRLYHLPSDPCETQDLLAPPHVLTAPEAAALAALQAAMDAI